MVKDGISRSPNSDSDGRCSPGAGNVRGSSPNLLPIGATSRPASVLKSVPASIPSSIAGQRGRKRRIRQIITTVNIPTPSVARSVSPMLAAKQRILPIKSAGTLSGLRPNRSFSCVAKITTAIPEVKPVVTGKGMNLINAPMRNKPNKINITPAVSVAAIKPLSPN